MEPRASYLIVGLFVLAMAAAATAFVVWFVGPPGERVAGDRYYLRFTESVTGLDPGSQVRYHGVPVGRVLDIVLDRRNIDQVLVTIEVRADTPVRVGTVATLKLQSFLSGILYVELSGGRTEARPLEAGPEEPHPTIPVAPSQLEALVASAPELFGRLSELADRLSQLADEGNRVAIADILRNLQTVSTELAGQMDAIRAVVDGAGAAASDLRAASAEIAGLVRRAEGEIARASGGVDTTLAAMTEAALSVQSMTAEIEALVAENREPLRAFSTEGLAELARLLEDSRTLVASLARSAEELERDPARVLFGRAGSDGYRP